MSLTSIICRILEGKIQDVIIEHMMKIDLFSCRQFGFISGRWTTLQLLKMLEDCTSMLDRGNINFIYTGFRKAFDKVPQKRLLAKILHYRIRGRVYDGIKDFLSQRTQQVTVDGKKSRSAPVTSGIPKRSVLGPLLFVIFFNDLPKRVDSTMLIFADDIKIYGRTDLPGDEDKLQKDLNAMVERNKQWHLPFHPDRAKVKHVGKSSAQCIRYSLGNDPEAPLTNIVTEEKDLRMTFDSTQKFVVHIAGKVKKANRTLGIIRRTFHFLDDETMKLLFCSLVRPNLEYASSLWSPRLVNFTSLVENVQRRATRLLKNSENQSYEDRLQRLDLPTLSFRRLRGDMIEVFKIMHSTAGYDCRASLTAPDESKQINTKSFCETQNREVPPKSMKICIFAKDCQGLELPLRISNGR